MLAFAISRKAGFILISGAILCNGGCGVYSTRASIPSHLKTVNIQTFENKTGEFLLPQQIAEELTGRFEDEGDLRVITSPSADALLEGTIVKYVEEPLTYIGGGDVIQRKVRIFVDVRFLDQVNGEVIWETKKMERWAIYDSDTEEEEDGIRKAAQKLAADVVSQALQGW